MPSNVARLVEAPLYSFGEADHLADVSHGTAKRWLTGYTYSSPSHQRIERPPVSPRDEQISAVSFLDLIEVVVIGKLKALDFSLGEIRAIVRNCVEIFNTDRPLVSLQFKTGGREAFVVHPDNRLIEVLRGKRRQAWQAVLAPFLDTIEYEERLARRWWPLGRNVPVVLDPDYSHGLPVIASAGVRTEIILERFQVGELTDEIADDFNISEQDVQRAIQFEVSRLKAA